MQAGLNPYGTDLGPKFAKYIVSANKVVACVGRLGTTPRAHWRMSPRWRRADRDRCQCRPGARQRSTAHPMLKLGLLRRRQTCTSSGRG